MVWVRLEDDIDEHPKLASVDDHAFAVYVCGLAYCNRNLTDGFIPSSIAMRLRTSARPKVAITALINARLWEPVDGGWRVHDFLHYQPSRQTVEAERSQLHDVRAAAGRAGGLAKAVANGKQTPSKTVAKGVANAKQNPSPVPGLTPGKYLYPAVAAAPAIAGAPAREEGR